jgi:hypothetical protein
LAKVRTTSGKASGKGKKGNNNLTTLQISTVMLGKGGKKTVLPDLYQSPNPTKSWKTLSQFVH